MSYDFSTATPAETKTYIGELFGAGTADIVFEVMENYVQWVFGGIDIAAGLILNLNPGLGLGWGYGFNLHHVGDENKAKKTASFYGFVTAVFGIIEVLTT